MGGPSCRSGRKGEALELVEAPEDENHEIGYPRLRVLYEYCMTLKPAWWVVLRCWIRTTSSFMPLVDDLPDQASNTAWLSGNTTSGQLARYGHWQEAQR